MGAVMDGSPDIRRSLKLTGADDESLLVACLSQLLFFIEQERLVFNLGEI